MSALWSGTGTPGKPALSRICRQVRAAPFCAARMALIAMRICSKWSKATVTFVWIAANDMVVARSFAVQDEMPLPEVSMARTRKTYVVIVFRGGLKLNEIVGALRVNVVQTP